MEKTQKKPVLNKTKTHIQNDCQTGKPRKTLKNSFFLPENVLLSIFQGFIIHVWSLT